MNRATVLEYKEKSQKFKFNMNLKNMTRNKPSEYDNVTAYHKKDDDPYDDLMDVQEE